MRRKGQPLLYFFGGNIMAERKFQAQVIKKLKEMFPESIILKNDPTYLQGIPDLLILNDNKWGMIEVKDSKDEPYRPNQPYYLAKCKKMSFSATIYPENMKECLNDIQQALQP